MDEDRTDRIRGPPTHIALLRRLVVQQRQWMTDEDLQAAIAACNLLPGPASTQLAIFCAQRLRGRIGAVIGGLSFILPSVLAITALSAVFLARSPPEWIAGAGAGASAAVAAVAVRAGLDLLIPSWDERSVNAGSAPGGRATCSRAGPARRWWAPTWCSPYWPAAWLSCP